MNQLKTQPYVGQELELDVPIANERNEVTHYKLKAIVEIIKDYPCTIEAKCLLLHDNPNLPLYYYIHYVKSQCQL